MHHQIRMLCVLLSVLLLVDAQKYPKAVNNYLKNLRLPRASQCTVGQLGSICLDCYTKAECIGEADPITTITCADLDASTPYCISDACTSIPDSACETAAESTSKCSDSGYFPDPTDCTKFTLCAAEAGESLTYTCPERFVYDPLTEQCKFKWLKSDCKQISCEGKDIVYEIFPGAPKLYAFCFLNSLNGLYETLVMRCPDNFEFNLKTTECEFKCKAVGRYSDPEDCRGYYECSKVGFKLQYVSWKCVTGFVFSASANKCVSGPTVCPT